MNSGAKRLIRPKKIRRFITIEISWTQAWVISFERKIAIKSRSWVIDVVGDSYIDICVIFGRWIHDLMNLFTIYPDFIKMSFIIDISIMNFEIFFKRSEFYVFLFDLVHMKYCFES